MSTAPIPVKHVTPGARAVPAWLSSRVVWSGLAIIVMWLTVLFVGLFGGTMVGSDGSSAPSAVAIALFALIGTWLVARWGLRPAEGDVAQLRSALDEERAARDRLGAEVAELRERLRP